MRSENWKAIKAFVFLYGLCAVVVGALCLVLYPLLEFSWWRVTGLFGLVILGIFGVAAWNVYGQMSEKGRKDQSGDGP